MFRDSWAHTASAALLVVAAAGFTAELLMDRPVLGPISLVLLSVPGFVISQTVRPVPLSWPEVVLVTLGTTLIVTILAGMVAAFSARGLSSSTVAATELVALTLAGLSLARATHSRGRHVPVRIKVRGGSILAALVGLTLAGAGFYVATRAAETQQQQASVMQFWTAASTTGGDPVLGIRNATGAGLHCSIAVSRPTLPEVDVAVGAIADGQSWSGQLPPRGASDTTRWQIALSCIADDGTSLQRRLFVDPVAS